MFCIFIVAWSEGNVQVVFVGSTLCSLQIGRTAGKKLGRKKQAWWVGKPLVKVPLALTIIFCSNVNLWPLFVSLVAFLLLLLLLLLSYLCWNRWRRDAKVKIKKRFQTLAHYTTLHYTTRHYTTLHYTTLHYTTLHYTTLVH